MAATLIITLQLDEEATTCFNRQRSVYYPAHANEVDAHITLFYRLPADEPVIPETLKTFSARTPFPVLVSGLQLFPNGVAYTLMAANLQLLHQSLQQQWLPWLIKRDQQPLRPHITVMNKVTAFKAQQLYEKLQQEFRPYEVMATGINTWRYLKGPWKKEAVYRFTDR